MQPIMHAQSKISNYRYEFDINQNHNQIHHNITNFSNHKDVQNHIAIKTNEFM